MFVDLQQEPLAELKRLSGELWINKSKKTIGNEYKSHVARTLPLTCGNCSVSCQTHSRN